VRHGVRLVVACGWLLVSLGVRRHLSARSLEASCGLLGERVERVMLYRLVDDQKAEGFPVESVCGIAGGGYVGLLRLEDAL